MTTATVAPPAVQASSNSASGKTADRLRQRASELLATEVDFISSDSFQEQDAASTILAGGNLPALVRSLVRGDKVSDLPPHLARLCNVDLLTAEDERDLFSRMNYLKFRAGTLRAKLNRNRPGAARVAEIEALLSDAEAIRDHLIRANMRLVISIVKKFVSPQFSFDDLLSDGMMTLMNAVEKFDFERGYRFSTYAYRSIARNAYRRIMDRKKEQSRYTAVPEESVESAEDEGGTASMDEGTWELLRGLLSQFMSSLDEREQLIVSARYALGEHRQVQTFQSIADQLGVSKERIRQLEHRAVGKLQAMAAAVSPDEVHLDPVS